MATSHEKPLPEGEGPLPNESMAERGAGTGKRLKKEKEKKLGSNRGVDTLFRNVYRVHINLTTLADSKANFLISVNSLIMFLVVVHGINYIDHKILLYPVAIVFFACIGSIVFAVLSARPQLRREQLRQSVDSNKVSNLLFFGDFARLPKDQFISELDEMLRDSSTAYPLMMSDLHELGHVLKKKFRLLRFSYGFLLYGLPPGMVLFLVLEIMLLKERL